MAKIQVQCVEHNLMITNLPLLAANSVGVDSVQFSFCPAWEGFSRSAIFYTFHEGAMLQEYTVLLDDSDECSIPEYVLRSEEPFEFCAVGFKDGKTISTKMLRYQAERSFFGTPAMPPSETVYDQLTKKLDEIETDLTEVVSATEELESYLSNVSDSENTVVDYISILEGSATTINDSTLTKIRNYAFNYYSALTSARFVNVKTIEERAFNNCTGIEDLKFVKLETAGNYAFGNCTKLKKADLGTVNRIASHAFYKCTALTAIILRYNGVVTLSADTSVSGATNAKFYVPSAHVNSYKNNEAWSAYSDKILAIEDYPDICE